LQEASAGDWAALARDESVPDEEDTELLKSVNEASHPCTPARQPLSTAAKSCGDAAGAPAQVCNKGLRLMLAGDDEGALIDFREELSSYGQYFSDSDNTRGATFIYVLYKLTEHVLPPEATNLEVRPGDPALLNSACPGSSAVAGTLRARFSRAHADCVNKQASYLEAFRRMYALLEESGWRVGKEGEKVAEEQSLEQMGYLAG